MAFTPGITNAIFLVVALFALAVYGVDPIVIKGSKFYYQGNGTEFVIRGVRYEAPGFVNRKAGDLASFIDPMTDETVCKQDIPHLVNLGINTLLITSYNADRDQKACMQLFSNAGIYVLIMLNGRTEIIIQINGTTGSEAGYVQANHYFRTVDFFAKWNNTLGLAKYVESFVTPQDKAPQFLTLQKRRIGEIKDYMKSRRVRTLPIGVFGTEHVPKRFNIPQYMACGEEAAADFYGTWPMCRDLENWCTDIAARHAELRDSFGNYGRPLIVAEGCQMSRTPEFDWVDELYGSRTTNPFAGGIYLDWLDRPDRLHEIDDPTKCPDVRNPGGLVTNSNGANITLNSAYSSLSARFASLPPTAVVSAPPDATQPLIPCEDLILKKGEAQANVTKDITMNPILPPKSSEKLCRCMMNTVSCMSDGDFTYESQTEKAQRILDTGACPRNASATLPRYCLGDRSWSDFGVYDSYYQCNWTETYSWLFSQYANTSEECKSVGGVAVTPTPMASLDKTCQVLLRQAGPSGTGTVVDFATEGAFISKSPSKNLSVGSKIGIGIAIALLLLSGLGGCLLYHRKKDKAEEEKKSIELSEYQKPELSGREISNPPAPNVQLDSNEMHELEGSGPVPLEADGGDGRVEVAGDFGAAELESSEVTQDRLGPDYRGNNGAVDA